MLYLSCLTRVVTSALHSAGNNFTYKKPIVSTLSVFFGILEFLVWLFLLRDLIRQVSLFFGIKFQ
jgi:hypothetical protein